MSSIYSWAAIKGADALLEIGGNMATISQVCSPSSPTPLHGNNLGGVAAGTFIGGLNCFGDDFACYSCDCFVVSLHA